MKKALFLMVFLVTQQIVSAQIFGSEKVIQEEAKVSRIYIWDKPRADSLTYKEVIPSDMKIIVGFTAKGKGVYVLAQDSVFNDLLRWFEDTLFLKLSQENIIGFEYVVAEVEDFSWLTKKKIRSLSGSQKSVAKAFNKSKKYTLMSQSPRSVIGKRDSDGTISPNFQQIPLAENLKVTKENGQSAPSPSPPKRKTNLPPGY